MKMISIYKSWPSPHPFQIPAQPDVWLKSIDQLSADPKWIGSREIADDGSVRDQSLTVP
jgi:hypothetical protein